MSGGNRLMERSFTAPQDSVCNCQTIGRKCMDTRITNVYRRLTIRQDNDHSPTESQSKDGENAQFDKEGKRY